MAGGQALSKDGVGIAGAEGVDPWPDRRQIADRAARAMTEAKQRKAEDAASRSDTGRPTSVLGRTATAVSGPRLPPPLSSHAEKVLKLISQCDVPVTRGRSMAEQWLSIDPLGIVRELGNQRFCLEKSLEGVKLKHNTMETFRYFRAERHARHVITNIILHLDGGGSRQKTEAGSTVHSPATWAFSVITKGADGSFAFEGYLAGVVSCDPGDPLFLGAEQIEQMSSAAEISAQIMAAMWVYSNELGLDGPVPVDVVFDNVMAAAVSQATATPHRQVCLSSMAAALWQLTSLKWPTTWSHVHSHLGEPLNELADSLVEHSAWVPACRHTAETPVRRCLEAYSTSQFKLLYLMDLPHDMADRYPQVNREEGKIRATPQGEVKFGLPAHVLGAPLDDVVMRQGRVSQWQAAIVSIATYNPCTMRKEGSMVAVAQQGRSLDLAAMGIQEARGFESFAKIYDER